MIELDKLILKGIKELIQINEISTKGKSNKKVNKTNVEISKLEMIAEKPEFNDRIFY